MSGAHSSCHHVKFAASTAGQGTAANCEEQCIFSAHQVGKLKVVNWRLTSGLLHPVAQEDL